jgi:hypothetical protein
MKNSFLDMVNTYNTDNQALCTFKSVDETYYTFVAKFWFFKLYLREIKRQKNENRILVYINTVIINPVDYLIEESSDGVNIKFKKSNFPYVLNERDKVYLSADVEYRG